MANIVVYADKQFALSYFPNGRIEKVIEYDNFIEHEGRGVFTLNGKFAGSFKLEDISYN
jgi:hypothetical protein